ncbi:hypothetical protein H6G00_01985 [Leptolyngbya sp. FACHB-541]|uniref:hypothetical protein n=1 Tax=Leptolyngbya sp. FACHB-541 TaxID=2692810 RepID=UPI001687A89D|nr:hypothetical protein [Leptolyngbya sp. FACHB-541]MBD1995402.1 hypothetical protein [Leptolyngbya sp. FACHB-541]
MDERQFVLGLGALIGKHGFGGDRVRVRSWEMDGEAVKGEFQKDDKLFQFRISNRGLSYKPTGTRSDSYMVGLKLQRQGASLTQRRKSASYAVGYVGRADAQKQCDSPTSYSCGATCISDKDQCHINGAASIADSKRVLSAAKRLSMFGSEQPKPRNEAVIAKRLKIIEDVIRGSTDHETLVSLDHDGNLMARIEGDETSVGFTEEEAKRMEGTILTHNHPSWRYPPDDPRVVGRSFSLPDIQTASVLNLSEIRAVSAGADYSLKPGEGGWGNYPLVVQPTYTKQAVLTHMELSHKIRQGEMSAEQAEQDFQGLIVQRVAKDLGWTYTESKRPLSKEDRLKAKKTSDTYGIPLFPGSEATASVSVQQTLGTVLRGALIAGVVAQVYAAYKAAEDYENYERTNRGQ